MTRLLILVWLGMAAWRWISRQMEPESKAQASPGGGAASGSDGRTVEQLAPCARCGAYFPRRLGHGDGGRYCSPRCAP